MMTHHRFSNRRTPGPALRRNARPARTAARLTCALAVMAAAAGSTFAQGTTKSSKIIEEKTLTTGDGVPIHITYFQSSRGKDAPAVILLHGEGGNRLVWRNKAPGFPQGLAGRLQDEGYAVVTVDLRGHGESKGASVSADPNRKSDDATNLTAGDRASMVQFDMEAVKEFLLAEHHSGKLNIRKTAIVAAGMSAPVAVNFAARDWAKKPYPDAPTLAASTPRGQDIRALALISPEENAPGVPAGRLLIDLRNPALGIAFLVAHGSKDKLDRGDAKRIHQKISQPMNKDRVYLLTFDHKLRGTDMLGQNVKLEESILGFLKKHLMELPDEWRDRKSPLE